MVQLINFIMAILSYVKFMILFVLDSWHFMKWTSVSNVGFDDLLSGSDIGTFNSFQKNNFVLGTKTGASVGKSCKICLPVLGNWHHGSKSSSVQPSFEKSVL